jgi:hypothetical protein
VLLENTSGEIRFLAEKIGTIERSVHDTLAEFASALNNRLVPLEHTVRDHSRLLERRT